MSVDGGSTASYAYDQQNRRYKKTVGATLTHYVWEGSQVIAEHNASTGSVLIDYVYSGNRMIAKVASGSTQYFLSDRLSVRLSLDSGGNVLGRQSHLPFGEDFEESGSQEKHHLTSYERDGETGCDYAFNRQYTNGVGRFAQVDRLPGAIDLPRSLNRFVYVSDDPVNRIDPEGLACQLVGINIVPVFVMTVDGPKRIGWNALSIYECVADSSGIPNTIRVPQLPDALAEILKAIKEGIDAALKALQKDECKRLLGSDNPAKVLEDLVKAGGLRFGFSYQEINDRGELVTKPFGDVDTGGIVTKVPDSKDPTKTVPRITLSITGPYFTFRDSVGNFRDYIMFSGLSDGEIRGAVIIHELRHVLGQHHGAGGKAGYDFTEEVVNACFK
ncbi:MAG TPA: RHS repeat-associated core domain-containing protein [Blastocatellia bacterium]|nr:RHS repeat-associated core domain-containing protein [Blastocatellia bacterium]